MRHSSWLAALLFATACATACSSGELGPGGGGDGDGDGDGLGDGNLPGGNGPVGTSDGKVIFESPARGAFIASSAGPTVRVAGRAPTGDELKINGETVTVAADGSFSLDVTPTAGMNVVDFELDSNPKVQGQRTFLWGDFAAPEDLARAAIGLRINRAGMDDDDAEVDDMSALAEAALAQRDVIKLLPRTYSFDPPVIGNVNVELTERTAGEPRVALSPRAGGVAARVSLPNVRIRFRLSTSCLITTCTVTGTVTVDEIVVTMDANLGLDGEAITAGGENANIDLVNFRYDLDGAAPSAIQAGVDYFVPDLERRIEDSVRPAIAGAVPADLSLALSALGLPEMIEIPQLGAAYAIETRFDSVDFQAEGGHVTAGARVSAVFEPGDPGILAPGWFRIGMAAAAGGFRVEPEFGVGASVDLVNQILHATWGQGVLVFDVAEGAFDFPGPTIGAVHATLLAPPVVVPASNGQLTVEVGDVMIDTTIDGTPAQIAVTLRSRVELSIDPATNSALIQLVGTPVLYAELITGPEGLVGTLLTTFIETSAPAMIGDALGAIPVPLPTVPLDAVADSLAGRELRIVAPAEIVTGEPAERVTLYGRLAAE